MKTQPISQAAMLVQISKTQILDGIEPIYDSNNYCQRRLHTPYYKSLPPTQALAQNKKYLKVLQG